MDTIVNYCGTSNAYLRGSDAGSRRQAAIYHYKYKIHNLENVHQLEGTNQSGFSYPNPVSCNKPATSPRNSLLKLLHRPDSLHTHSNATPERQRARVELNARMGLEEAKYSHLA
jgi:hypothetical protein